MTSSVLEKEVHQFIQVILTFNSKGLQKKPDYSNTTSRVHLLQKGRDPQLLGARGLACCPEQRPFDTGLAEWMEDTHASEQRTTLRGRRRSYTPAAYKKAAGGLNMLLSLGVSGRTWSLRAGP